MRSGARIRRASASATVGASCDRPRPRCSSARARAMRRCRPTIRQRKTRLDVRVFGSAGAPLKAVFRAAGETVTVRSEINARAGVASARSTPPRCASRSAAWARRRSSSARSTRRACAADLFLPISELNHLRQQAVDELLSAATGRTRPSSPSGARESRRGRTPTPSARQHGDDADRRANDRRRSRGSTSSPQVYHARRRARRGRCRRDGDRARPVPAASGAAA